MLKFADKWAAIHHATVAEPIPPSAGFKASFIADAKRAGDILMLPDDQEGVVWNDKLIAPVSLNKSKYTADALQGAINGGKAYAYPLFLETMMIYYNKSLVPASVFKGNYTWDTLAKWSAKFANSHPGSYGMAWQWDNVYYNAEFFQGYSGGGFFSRSGSGFNPKKVLVATKGTVQGVSYLKHIITESGTSLPTFLGANKGDGTAQALFETGKLGMIFDGPWSDGEWKQVGFNNYGVARPPAMGNGKLGYPFVGVQDLVVNKYSKNLKLAQSLASYLSLNSGVSMYTAGGRIPAAKSALKTLAKNPELKTYQKALGHVEAMPNIPAMGLVWTPVGNELTLYLEGKVTATAGMKAAKAAIIKSGG
jgi:maltose-binding protein MalE